MKFYLQEINNLYKMLISIGDNRMTKDEEIWLRAYCAGISADQPGSYCKLVAEEALKSFKARFPDTDEDLPDFLRRQA